MRNNKFDQIFLKDINIINFIIKNINPKYYQNIVEIGPGLGSITLPIIKYLNLLTLIEIDKNISNKLIRLLNINSNKIILYNEDARFFNYNKLIKNKYDKLRIFGNLPYNNSLLIIINCIKYYNIIHDIHFMIQRELSEKLISNKLCKSNILIRCFFNINIIYKNIHPNSFYPKPKVYSSIIKIIPKKKNLSIKYLFFLKKISRILFCNKRKIIKNNLKNLFNINNLILLEKLNFINLNLRAENLSINQFIKLLFFYLKNK
ncbi:16S rRNA (adenine(1518)-N(6)/adenine(1519)-N(6))-dimethyltransferase RsmA [endosymbiont of Pachyrhynchus infernalis]|uniref:16S rRNA (adenine(1518)-N(6)/adenine(1519)-N(6))- dimethyltransferase RsmA n=1 Tax=endosymbiont of Pachyrhynchus infernalis TaxID=1971488 RepID=UPI000DC6DA21|nr:16S rRNA (adenine(1518)-N(6)/adenine(1519)-N(6))-dimethyltransferase RsmA [endosymbiont of Pachyrhynchus infernalis]BBA84904.1 ribosomal RNA small subunit methyltransferase A [endosymbiont of Pachyrhynchus infernalis]